MKFCQSCILFALALATPALLRAQGSGAVAPSGAGAGAGVGDLSPFEVTRTSTLRLLEVRKDGSLLLAEQNGKTHVAKLDPRVRIRADKKTELAGKKKILPADLEAGMMLKITYRASDSLVVELRILKV